MVIFIIAKQKGGVGRTKTAVMRAHRLTLAGKRALHIDLNPQGKVGLSLGLPITERMTVVSNFSMTIVPRHPSHKLAAAIR